MFVINTVATVSSRLYVFRDTQPVHLLPLIHEYGFGYTVTLVYDRTQIEKQIFYVTPKVNQRCKGKPDKLKNIYNIYF